MAARDRGRTKSKAAVATAQARKARESERTAPGSAEPTPTQPPRREDTTSPRGGLLMGMRGSFQDVVGQGARPKSRWWGTVIWVALLVGLVLLFAGRNT